LSFQKSLLMFRHSIFSAHYQKWRSAV